MKKNSRRSMEAQDKLFVWDSLDILFVGYHQELSFPHFEKDEEQGELDDYLERTVKAAFSEK